MNLEVFEVLPDAILAIDSNDVIIFANAAASHLVQISALRLQGKIKISDVLFVDGKSFDRNLISSGTYQFCSLQLKNETSQSRPVGLAFFSSEQLKENFSLVYIKDSGHEVDLARKYESEMQQKDQRLRQIQITNSVLRAIRNITSVNLIIEQMALTLMNELDIPFSMLLNPSATGFQVALIAKKDRMAVAKSLALPMAISDVQPLSSQIISKSRSYLPTELKKYWKFPYFLYIPFQTNGVHLSLLFPLGTESDSTLIDLAQMLLDQTSTVIEGAVYQRLSNTDELTGAYNRRFLQRCAEPFFLNQESQIRNCAVITMDIDFFKKINDTYGHAAGDHVLQQVGSHLIQEARISDVVARVGGEEFTILLSDVDVGTAHLVAERLRVNLSQLNLTYENSALNVTASFGVAGKLENRVSTFEALMDIADKALYVSKQNGRNQVTIARSN